MVDLQFSGILNCEEAFVPRNEHPETIECGRLTRTCAARNHEIGWSGIETLDPNPHHGCQSTVDRAPTHQVNDGDWILSELSNRESGTIG